MQTRRILVALMIAALVSGGCGDDDGDVATDSSTTTTAADTTTTSEAAAGKGASATGAQGAKAKAAVVQLSDLPASGWREQAPEDTPDHETTWQALATCLGIGDLKQDETGSATSPTYVTGLAQQVTSTVAYVPVGRAGEIAAAFASDKFEGCAKTAIADDVARNAPEGAEVVSVDVVPLDLPRLGALTTSYRATGMLTIGPGIQITVYTDVVAVFSGPAISRLVFINGGPAGAPFPDDLERSLVEKVVTRAGA
jgi:hypothetical protein